MTPLLAAVGFDLLGALREAGLVAQLTLAVLCVMSVLAWATWGSRHLALGLLVRRCRSARRTFLEAPDPASFEARCRRLPTGPVPRAFEAAVEEYRQGVASVGAVERWTALWPRTGRTVVERRLADCRASEMARARRGLNLLGSIGATAPFVGLFGTVWGVMDAFAAIGELRSADLSVVAPGVAEALLATAAGLLAAVPAVWAHNALLAKTRALALELDHFETELMNALERGVAASQGGAAEG